MGTGTSYIDQILQRHTPREHSNANVGFTPSRHPLRRGASSSSSSAAAAAAGVVSPRFYEFSARSASLIAEARAAAEAAQAKRKAAEALVAAGRTDSSSSSHHAGARANAADGIALALEALFDHSPGTALVQAPEGSSAVADSADSGTGRREPAGVREANHQDNKHHYQDTSMPTASPARADPAAAASHSQQHQHPQHNPSYQALAINDNRHVTKAAVAAHAPMSPVSSSIANNRPNAVPPQVLAIMNEKGMSALVSPRVAAAADDQRIYNVGGTWVSKRASPDTFIAGAVGGDAMAGVPGGMLMSLETSLATPLVLDVEVRSDLCCVSVRNESEGAPPSSTCSLSLFLEFSSPCMQVHGYSTMVACACRGIILSLSLSRSRILPLFTHSSRAKQDVLLFCMRVVQYPYSCIHANTQNSRQRKGGRETHRTTGYLGKKLTRVRFVYPSSAGEGGYGAAASPGPPIESPRAQALRIHRGFACSGTNSQKYSIF